MRIVSWNINSLRLRILNLKKIVEEQNPDIICLQETKVADEFFPYDFLIGLGYPYIEFSGEKSYNGVAIISRIPLTKVQKQQFCSQISSRHIAVLLPDDTELHNFYVPAGGDEPDPRVNPKFAAKLEFLDNMTAWFTQNKGPKIIMLGDINVAPLEHDVWSHKQLLKVVSHTPIEVEKVELLRSSLNWYDVMRHDIPEQQKLYSWWSYRNQDWRKSDRGRRLDHIWVTPALKSSFIRSYIMKDARDWQQPSDHVPIIAEFQKFTG
jgi:exodeoxyribonuclease-3